MSVTGNFAAFRRTVRDARRAVALDEATARGVVKIVAAGIRRRCAREVAPDGTPWAPNKESYLRRHPEKRGHPIGELTGRMLSQREVEGTWHVEDDRTLVMQYGASFDAIMKAIWFARGKPGQDPRPFFGLDDETRVEVVDYLKSRVRERLARGR